MLILLCHGGATLRAFPKLLVMLCSLRLSKKPHFSGTVWTLAGSAGYVRTPPHSACSQQKVPSHKQLKIAK